MVNLEYQMTTQVRRKAVWGGHAKMTALALGAILLTLLTACSDSVRTGSGSSYLQLNSLTAAKGGGTNSGSFASSLPSDVLTVVSGNPTVFADNGQATMQLQMKDTLDTPSSANAITLTQYHVKYIRSDGHNVQGVDVPYEFDGGLGVTIAASGTVSFTLVRVQAKQEAPLAALVNNSQVLSTVAEVTFYGHDQNGNAVTVVGHIDVDFANWGD